MGTRWGEEAAGRRHWVVGGGLLNKLTASSPTQLGGTPPQRGKGMWRVKPQYQVSLSAGHLSRSACCPGPCAGVDSGGRCLTVLGIALPTVALTHPGGLQ